MSADTEAHEALTTLLAAHALIVLSAPSLAAPRCSCGETMGERPSFYFARHWHAAHVADVLTAHGWGRLPDADTVEEWGVQYENLARVRREVNKESARFTANFPTHPTGLNPRAVRRTVTTYARHVTPWEVVADGEGGRGVGS